jgi:hypothetical protein
MAYWSTTILDIIPDFGTVQLRLGIGIAGYISSVALFFSELLLKDKQLRSFKREFRWFASMLLNALQSAIPHGLPGETRACIHTLDSKKKPDYLEYLMGLGDWGAEETIKHNKGHGISGVVWELHDEDEKDHLVMDIANQSDGDLMSKLDLPSWQVQTMRRNQVGSVLGVPLVCIDGQFIGVLCITNSLPLPQANLGSNRAISHVYESARIIAEFLDRNYLDKR